MRGDALVLFSGWEGRGCTALSLVVRMVRVCNLKAPRRTYDFLGSNNTPGRYCQPWNSKIGKFDVHRPAISIWRPPEVPRSGRRMGTHGAIYNPRSRCMQENQPVTGLSMNLAESHWIVPFGRNSRFTGREFELDQLQHMLLAKEQFTKVAVSDLGGVGKTQLVLEFLYRRKGKSKHCSAIWIQATTVESLNQGRGPRGRPTLRTSMFEILEAEMQISKKSCATF